jgi:hypothetical protein
MRRVSPFVIATTRIRDKGRVMRTMTFSLLLLLAACGGSAAEDDVTEPVTEHAQPSTIYLKLGPPQGGTTQPAPTAAPGPTATATTSPSLPCYACLAY